MNENIEKLSSILDRSIHLEMYEKLFDSEEQYISKQKGIDFNNIECIMTDNREIFDRLGMYFNALSDAGKIWLYEVDYPLK